MRLNWKKWRNGVGMLDVLADNGIQTRTRFGKDRAIIWIFFLQNGTVLGAVREFQHGGSKGQAVYRPCANTGWFRDLSDCASITHRSLGAALKDVMLTAAPFFNKDGTRTKENLFPGSNPTDGGTIRIIPETLTVLTTDGRSSWINQ
ncbi:MAG: hypothetical protein WCS18_12560 [Sphaerochaetaceae bacterium]